MRQETQSRRFSKKKGVSDFYGGREEVMDSSKNAACNAH